jgi:RimJ/RimL family protein N-acetyltransferase
MVKDLPPNWPSIQKQNLIVGHQLRMRNANVDDAAFILGLRLDPAINKHLSVVSPDLADQIAWLAAYAEDSSQAYFVIEYRDGRPIGTVRFYDAREDSFCWGSWIIKPGSHPSSAAESVAIVYSYARRLGFQRSHFEVRKDNERVWRAHERSGAERTGEDDVSYFYSMSTRCIDTVIKKYSDLLPNGITLCGDAED